MLKNLIILLSVYFIFPLSNLFPQWIQQKDYLPVWGPAWAIDAYDSLNAVFYGILDAYQRQGLFITKDGGKTWNPRIIPAGDIIDIEMVTPQNIVYGTSGGNIYRSSDGGINWKAVYGNSYLTNFIDYIEFFGEIHGIAIGDCISTQNPWADRPAILSSGTYGIAWSEIISSNGTKIGRISGDTWRRIDFINPNIGYFRSSGEVAGLYNTTDGGIIWTKLNQPGEILLLKFYNENIGLVATYPIDTGIRNFRIFLTTDGCQTWTESNNVFGPWPCDFEFLPGDSNKVWFTNSYGLFYSSDMGLNWTEHKITEDNLLGRDIVFTDNKHGWLLCDSGKVFYTNNNGGLITNVFKENEDAIFTDYVLEQNYPNPFNPETVIGYRLPAAGYVSLKIYDILGNEIAVLVNEYKQAGKYQIQFSTNGLNLSSGVYFYKLSAGNFSAAKKMIVIK